MNAIAAPAAGARSTSRWALASESLAARGGLVLLACALFVFLTVPLAMILVRSVEGRAGEFVGLANFMQYVQSPSLAQSTRNTLTFAALTTLTTVPLAFLFAYAIQRSCIPAKGVWRNLAMIPILAPSLLAAISFIYLFGNQGAFKFMLGWVGLTSIYGMPGMVMAMTFASFPHAVMILMAALALSDARLYEAADSMGTSDRRKFMTITLPGAKYGLISASMVVFTMAVSEFGVPKVIGGNTSVLAVDIYKQVIGQQNFSMGAVVALALLIPAVVAFVIDHLVQRKQQALLTARSVPYQPRPARLRDRLLLVFVIVIAALLLLVVGMAALGSLIRVWPYNMSLTLNHYIYGFEEYGIEHAYRNSLVMATWCAVLGATLTFAGAYWLEKTRGADLLRPAIRLQALLPMAVPGLVLGIGYILFFNLPTNPLNFLYGTMAILVISTLVHFYSSSHLTAVTALKQIDGEFEAVSASLKVPFYKTFWRVTVPVCLPSILDIGRYYFVNAMTTISAVVFLYSPQTTLAAISILHLDEAGALGSAAAMATLIVLTSAVVTAILFTLEGWLLRRTQKWRNTAKT
ncbi:MAG: putative 2-aminoethylphosphonate ABC transporter permease subunit [Pseudomonadota bacterium]|jgi:iron(III) transport system permease protein|nr:putative 2-aminoethylphosphonate ABC transporter permease subunit [Burkholderiaceae bacterium]MDQ3445523.1 putative 2-aminoethylphosphonate ABC transporter permease subunit [Pseudomonadota bacterium]